jgi:hypothetical protein
MFKQAKQRGEEKLQKLNEYFDQLEDDGQKIDGIKREKFEGLEKASNNIIAKVLSHLDSQNLRFKNAFKFLENRVKCVDVEKNKVKEAKEAIER